MHKNSIVVVYESHASAAEGVKELGQAGFDVKKLSGILPPGRGTTAGLSGEAVGLLEEAAFSRFQGSARF